MDSVLAILGIFLCSTISFFVLFFTTPYTTGIQLREISKNGIYQWIYMILSGLGNILYMLLECSTNLISSVLKKERNSCSVILINSLLYVGAIFLITQSYAWIISNIINPDVSSLTIGGKSSYDRLSDSLIVFQLFRAYASANSILDALKITVTICLLYYCVTVVFFSIMYGLMSQKIYEFQFISKYCTEEQRGYLLDFEANSLDIRQLPHSLLTEACNFVDSISSIKNFQIPGSKGVFLVLILLFSTVQYVLNQIGLIEFDITVHGLIFELVESAGILNILLSFLVTCIFTKCLCLFNYFIYKISPPNVQETITTLSHRAAEAAAQIKEKRNNWSDDHDAVWLETDGQASRKENKMLERANLSYQSPSKKREQQKSSTAPEDRSTMFDSHPPLKKTVEKRYPPQEKPQKHPSVKPMFLDDPEGEKKYLQQEEERKKRWQEWENYKDYIKQNPEALPDFEEMPEWLQNDHSKWIELKGL